MRLPGGRIDHPGDILPGEHRRHAGQRFRSGFIDRFDLCMGIRAAQNLRIKHVTPFEVRCECGFTLHQFDRVHLRFSMPDGLHLIVRINNLEFRQDLGFCLGPIALR